MYLFDRHDLLSLLANCSMDSRESPLSNYFADFIAFFDFSLLSSLLDTGDPVEAVLLTVAVKQHRLEIIVLVSQGEAMLFSVLKVTSVFDITTLQEDHSFGTVQVVCVVLVQQVPFQCEELFLPIHSVLKLLFRLEKHSAYTVDIRKSPGKPAALPETPAIFLRNLCLGPEDRPVIQVFSENFDESLEDLRMLV